MSAPIRLLIVDQADKLSSIRCGHTTNMLTSTFTGFFAKPFHNFVISCNVSRVWLSTLRHVAHTRWSWLVNCLIS